MELPKDSQRHLIVGRTGSGKSHFAVYTLALRSYPMMPWILVNFKDDELLNQLPSTELDGMKLPKKILPGLYMVRPEIGEGKDEHWEAMRRFLGDIWSRTHIGIYFDEMLPLSTPKIPELRRLLTQGRSRLNPLIMCTQAPKDIDRYCFSEAEHMNIFALSDDREADRIHDMTGLDLDFTALPSLPDELPYSYHIDRIRRRVTLTPPAPDTDTILDLFNSRLRQTSNRHII